MEEDAGRVAAGFLLPTASAGTSGAAFTLILAILAPGAATVSAALAVDVLVADDGALANDGVSIAVLSRFGAAAGAGARATGG